MDKLIFYVQGRAKEPYKVTFWKDEIKLHSGCNCKATVNGLHCKHRIQLLAGNSNDVIIKKDSSSFSDLTNLIKGTDAQKICEHFKEASIGEEIKIFSNSYPRQDKLFEEAEEIEPTPMEEIPNEIFENNFVFKNGKTNIIFQLDGTILMIFIADKRKLAKLNLTEIRPLIYTKSNYYLKCYETYTQSNMSILKEEILKFLR